jgi:hypothetical protein
MLRLSVYVVMVAAFAIALYLRLSVPQAPLWYAVHDDALMVIQSERVWNFLTQLGTSGLPSAERPWLGAWDNRLTAKPVGYAFLIVLAHVLQISPVVLAFFGYAFACVLVYLVIRSTGLGRVPSVLVYVALLFNPAVYGVAASRIYRELTICALVIVVIALAGLVGIRLPILIRKRRNWQVVCLFFLLGLAMGYLYLVKEDAFAWVAVPAVCVFAALLFESRRSRTLTGVLRQNRRIILAIAVVFLSGLMILPGPVIALNRVSYGFTGVNDFSSGAFPSLWTALTGIKAGPSQDLIAVNDSQRASMYEVSPTAVRMHDFLEQPPGVGWRGISCSMMSICDESGPWFEWDLRDGLAYASKGTSSPQFQSDATRIAADIQAACFDGRISCERGGLAVGLPAATRLDPRATGRSFLRFLGAAGDFRAAGPVLKSDEPDSEPPTLAWTKMVDADPLSYPRAAPEWTIKMVESLRALYRIAVPLLMVVTLFMIVFVRKLRKLRRLMIVGLGYYGAFLLHILVLAVFDGNKGSFYFGASTYLAESSGALIAGVLICFLAALPRSARESVHR